MAYHEHFHAFLSAMKLDGLYRTFAGLERLNSAAPTAFRRVADGFVWKFS